MSKDSPPHRPWHLRRLEILESQNDKDWVAQYCAACARKGSLFVVNMRLDDGYRCVVCGSAFCDPMEHH